MEINNNSFSWTREPAEYAVKDGKICITTIPHTDMWQRTYYHFQSDNAPMLLTETDEKYFSMIVKTDFTETHYMYDQCGIVMYLDSDNWIKASVEYEDENIQHLGGVVTNGGYSDWATTEIPASVKVMWYRLSRKEDDFVIECSEDGQYWKLMRMCHMNGAQDKIKVGLYACSPQDSSFTAVFSDLQMTDFPYPEDLE